MQAPDRVDIDLVLTGTDALAAGIEQRLWEPLLAEHAPKFPERDGQLPEPREEDAGARAGPGLVRHVHARPGPLLEYNPDKVKQPPTTPQELLAWCKAQSEPASSTRARPIPARAARS